MNRNIGNDVKEFICDKSSTFAKYPKSQEYEEKILQILIQSERPLNISEVGTLSGLSWSGAKSVLTNLMFRGKLECFRCGRAFLFRPMKESSKLQQKTPCLKAVNECKQGKE